MPGSCAKTSAVPPSSPIPGSAFTLTTTARELISISTPWSILSDATGPRASESVNRQRSRATQAGPRRRSCVPLSQRRVPRNRPQPMRRARLPSSMLKPARRPGRQGPRPTASNGNSKHARAKSVRSVQSWTVRKSQRNPMHLRNHHVSPSYTAMSSTSLCQPHPGIPRFLHPISSPRSIMVCATSMTDERSSDTFPCAPTRSDHGRVC